ncbi:MAG: mannosyltransferase family protein [Chloroflexota bacterium]
MRDAVVIAAIWRLCLALFGVIVHYAVPACTCQWSSALLSSHWSANPLSLVIDVASRGDARYYVAAAQHGYHYSTVHQSSMGFYPMYPVLIRLGSLLLGNDYVAAFTISTLCLFVAVALLAVWLVDHGLGTHTRRVTALLLCFPFAFFYGAMYTESLYLMLVLGAFLAAERGRWGLTALAMFLITLTRPTGIVLLLPLAILAAQHGRRIRWKAALPGVAALLAQGGFMTYQYLRFGTPFAYVRAKSVPGWAVSPSRIAHDLLLQGKPGRSSALLMLVLAIAILFLTTVPGVYRRFGPTYAVYVAVAVLASLSAGLPGMHRYVIVAFPAFADIAIRLGRRSFFVVALASTYGLLMFDAVYAGGYGLA